MGAPKLAVWKFASCDGCQLSLLDFEDELLALTGQVEIAYFLEATRAEQPPPYDVSLVEGSVTTPHDIERLKQVREDSKFVVAIGACATSGGIQALRNLADVAEFASVVYAKPEYLSTLSTSKPASDYVKVDFELRGCPVNHQQLLAVLVAFLAGRKPDLMDQAVCFECKLRGVTCLSVAQGIGCLGPVTHAGCGAICTAYNRGCFGCFGPMTSPNTPALVGKLKDLGMSDAEVERVFRTFNVNADEFAAAAGGRGTS